MKDRKVFEVKGKFLFRLNSTIKGKLIIICMLMLIIPMLVITIFNYQESSKSLNKLGETNLENSVEMTIEYIDTLNEEVEKGNLSLEEAQEKVKVSILGEKNSDGTRPINKEIDLGENGFMYILDQEGNRVAHPFWDGTNFWEASDPREAEAGQKLLEAGKNGGSFLHNEGPMPNDKSRIEQKVNYVKDEPNWGWTIVAGTFMLDFNQQAKDNLQANIIVMVVTLMIGILIVWLFANHISKPISLIKDRLTRLSEGDLTEDPIQLKTKDETSKLADATNQLQSKLKEIIHQISDASETMTSQSAELTQSANEVKCGSEQIAVTMEELASGSETQANASSEISSAMSAFTAKVVEANEHGEQIQESSYKVLDLTKEGSQLMDSSTSKMLEIDHIVKGSVQQVKELNTQSQEISKLVVVIKEVADQTNLLALNAAIEAARAGEHGRGFSVVADEVRKLAEQTASSVTDITRIVNNIQSGFHSVTESLELGYREVERGTSQIQTTGETFNGISTSLTEMADRINSVSANLSDIAANSQEMNSSIEEIAATAEESAAGIEETSASIQQTSSSMDEIARSSDDLAQLAEKLNRFVHQFKL